MHRVGHGAQVVVGQDHAGGGFDVRREYQRRAAGAQQGAVERGVQLTAQLDGEARRVRGRRRGRVDRRVQRVGVAHQVHRALGARSGERRLDLIGDVGFT